MKKLLTLTLVLISINLFSQDYLLNIKLSKFKYGNDSVTYSEPKIKRLSMDINDCSEIIELEQMDNLILGVQAEILKSTLGLSERYIAGLAFFKKKDNGAWDIILRSPHGFVQLDKEDDMKFYKELGGLPPEISNKMDKPEHVIKTSAGPGVHIEYDIEFITKK
jgi:hypothetical protein